MSWEARIGQDKVAQNVQLSNKHYQLHIFVPFEKEKKGLKTQREVREGEVLNLGYCYVKEEDEEHKEEEEEE